MCFWTAHITNRYVEEMLQTWTIAALRVSFEQQSVRMRHFFPGGIPSIAPRDQARAHLREEYKTWGVLRAQLGEAEMSAMLDPTPLAPRLEILRTAIHTQLDHLSPDSYCFNQADLPWNTGDGMCHAFTLEFAYWRAAGRAAQAILGELRHPSCQTRLHLVQTEALNLFPEVGKNAHRRRQARLVARFPNPAAYWAAARMQGIIADPDAGCAATFAGLARRVDFPRGFDPFSFVCVKRFMPEFSLEALIHFAPDECRDWTLGALLPFLSPSPRVYPEPAAHFIERMTHSWSRWQGCFANLASAIRGTPYPLVLMTLISQNRSNPTLTFAQSFASHVVLADFTPHHAGLFDSNYGYFSLATASPIDRRFLWLMAMLVMLYQITEIVFSVTCPLSFHERVATPPPPPPQPVLSILKRRRRGRDGDVDEPHSSEPSSMSASAQGASAQNVSLSSSLTPPSHASLPAHTAPPAQTAETAPPAALAPWSPFGPLPPLDLLEPPSPK